MEDFDYLARLLRAKIEFSISLLLDRATQLLRQYEEALNLVFNQKNEQGIVQLKSLEKQLGYTLQVCLAVFSYGLPSSTSKLPVAYDRLPYTTPLATRCSA